MDNPRIIFEKARKALDAGTITREEHDAFLIDRYGTTSLPEALTGMALGRVVRDADGRPWAHDAAMLITGFFVIMISLFSALFYTTGGITGAVILDMQLNETYAQSTSLQIQLNETTRLNVSGTAQGLGDVRIVLESENLEYVIHEYLHGPSRTKHAILSSSRYEEGEIVRWNATNVSSAWLMTQDEAIPLGNATTVENLTRGNYSLKLIINDTTLMQEVLRFEVVAKGTDLPSEQFNTCGEACRLDATGNATLRIEISGNVTFMLNRVVASSQPNRGPVLTENVPDVSGVERVQIDLSIVFRDPDNDALYYDSSNYDENTETLNGSILTIEGIPGTYTYVAYASDLEELTSSNLFTVTLGAANATPVNETMGEILANGSLETNKSSVGNISDEQDTTGRNLPASVSGLCSHPDPNKRPLDCLQNNSERFFREQRMLLKDAGNRPVARITSIGNLLIRGGIHEQQPFEAQEGDYVVSYEDEYGNLHVSVWFDSTTGDLWLRGQLHEENPALEAPPGSFALRNRQGVTMLYALPKTGDVYIRGNLITRRGDVQ